MDKMEKMFDYVAFVRLSEEGKPELDGVYPNEKKDETRGILHFCWPEGKAAIDNLQGQTRSENFSFVLTESDGSKRFGYCRRFLRTSPPECYCVVSRLPSPVLFQELLTVVELRRSQSSEMCMSFLEACHEAQCPAPGSSVTIRVDSITGTKGVWDEHTLRRPEVNEVLLDYVTFYTLFTCVSVKNIIHLFSNAMLERRIILVAENLATLSSCVMAASNLLQPFHWQHVYIPVLPLVLIDYCFTTEHQILTNEGFLFMHEFERRHKDTSKASLLVASYDDISGQLVYEPATRIVMNKARTQEVVEFNSHNGVANLGDETRSTCSDVNVDDDNDNDDDDDDDDDGGESDFGDSGRVSLVVTPEHDMFVRRGSRSTWKKEKAGSLLDAADDFAMLSCAPQGIGSHCDSPLLPLEKQSLQETASVALQSEIFPLWVWLLDAVRVRVLVVALSTLTTKSDGAATCGVIRHVKSESFRDDCVRLLIHAGYRASFVERSCRWQILWSSEVTVTMKPGESGGSAPRKVSYTGQTWCVSVPHGYVMARRVRCDSEGRVVRASAPALTGNCTAPMPFFVGVLKSCLPVLESMPLEEVLVLDVENDRFLKDPGFEDTLPKEAKKKLGKTLKAITLTPERDSDLQIASTFYQFFFDLFAGYEEYYELRDIPRGRGDAPDAPVKQGYRFEMPRFLATKTPPQRAFIEQLDQVQIMQSFFQENEHPDRRYKFVDQASYIQHLTANQLDQEVADAMRAASRALGSAWQGMKEAAAKKRAQRKEEEAKAAASGGSSGSSGSSNKSGGLTLRGKKNKALLGGSSGAGDAGAASPSPVRVPASENIDLILANERKGGGTSPSVARRAPTHRPCVSCHIYIDLSFQVCPHCSKEQPARTPISTQGNSPNQRPPPPIGASPAVEGSSPVLTAALQADDKYKKPPPPPPKTDNAAKRATLRKPPPPPGPPKSGSLQTLPPVTGRPVSSISQGALSASMNALPDISSFHISMTLPDDDEDGARRDDGDSMEPSATDRVAASRLSHTLSELGLGDNDDDDDPDADDPYSQFSSGPSVEPPKKPSPRHLTARSPESSTHGAATEQRGHRRIQSSFEPRPSWRDPRRSDTDVNGDAVSPRTELKRTATQIPGSQQATSSGGNRPAGWTSVKAPKKATAPSVPSKEAPSNPLKRASSQASVIESPGEAGKRRPAPPPPPASPGGGNTVLKGIGTAEKISTSPSIPPKRAPAQLPHCVYCGERAERAEARFCIACGKEIAGLAGAAKRAATAGTAPPRVLSPPSAPAPNPDTVELVLPSRVSNGNVFVGDKKRDTRVKECPDCGAENSTIASNCVNCKLWF